MPTAVLPVAAENEPRRKRFTRAEVGRLQDEGFFEGQRFELIDGDLIDKMGQKPAHATAIQLVLEYVAHLFGLKHVRAQAPIDVAAADWALNEPEPDIVVTAGERSAFTERHPRGEETLLIVEVSDTSIRQDTVRKRDLYARAGVPEYWVLNIQDRELIVHRNPHLGRYQEILTLSEGAMVAPVSRPDSLVGVDTLLP